MCKGRLLKWTSLSTEAQLGNLDGGLITRDFERQMEASFIGDPEGYVKALEMGVFFHRGPVVGNMDRMLLSKGLREKGEIFLSGELLLGNVGDT